MQLREQFIAHAKEIEELKRHYSQIWNLLVKPRHMSNCDQTIGHLTSVNTIIVLGFRFVLLFSLVVTFMHSCSENFSIAATRNAWVGYFVCLCVMVDRSCVARWMVEKTIALKKVCGMNERRKHKKQV
jgi:Na+/proline symporter